jgi:hypothetical protein
MSLANVSQRRGRQLALGALTVLLHLVVFDWFSSRLGRPREEAVPPAAAPALLLAQLIAAGPQAPLPPPSAPQPRLVPPPLPEVAPEPVEVAEASPAGAPAVDGAAAGDGLAASGPQAAPDGQGSAAAAAADVQSQQAQQPPQAQPAQAAAVPALPEPRRYKIDLPPAADITLDVARTDADGTRWNGEALLSWTLAPSGYRIRVEAGIRVVFARVNLLTLTSEGMLGEEGFVPTLMTEKRRGRALTATHFNRQDGSLTFSASQAKYALLPGTQDKASLPLQLAAIARGDPKQLSGNIDILVGEDRDASVFSFVVAGQEQIDTRLGRIATWHLVRPPKPGSYNSRLELWLAPGYGWYPVQTRNVEASGATTTQTVSNIVTKEAGS